MSNQLGSLKMGQKFKKTPAGEIPVEWGLAAISDLCQVNPEVIKESTPPDTQLKYIDIASIEHTGYVSDTKSIQFKDAPSRARRVVKAGDIIVSTVRPYLKAFARIADSSNNLIASTGFAVLRPKPNVCGSYIYQHVLSDAFVKHLEGRMVGSNYPAVNAGDVAEYQVPVPTSSEQKKIGQILDEVDVVVEKIQDEIGKTKKLKNGLMRQLLTRGIGHKKFKETKVGEIPMEWDCGTLDSVKASIKNAIVDGPFGSNLKTIHYRDSGIPVIQSGFVTSNRFEAKDYVYVDESLFVEQQRSRVCPGDIVMAKIGAQAGTCAILPQDHPIGILAGNSLKITTDPAKCLPEYLVFFLHYRYSQDGLGAIKTITAQPAISLKSLKSYEIPVPDIKEQAEIVAILSDLDADMARKTALLDKTVGLKKGLMRMLLTGKVRVG